MPVSSLRFAAPALAAAWVIAAAAAHAQQPRPALDVHFVPTPEQVVDRMLQMAGVTDKDFVIDLGSGDGRIVITAAQKFGARGMGVDLDPERIKEANANRQKAGVAEKVEFRQQNLFETDLSKATVLTMYLLPRLNLQLRPTLLDLKPGTRLASHAFDMGDWRADRHEKIDGRDAYFWVVPAKVNGTWQIEDGNSKFEIDVAQRYQTFEGVARAGNVTVPLRETSLRGDEIRFVTELESGKPREFRGRVNGNKIEALPPEAGGPQANTAISWRAAKAQ
ncbi:MAG: methyltransferase domain-containing protein [Bradyrhizobiaceae bacterium]|nr:methyltransferase domain-containing protein [Bradyrhizobiaceae bacterium]